VSAAKGGIVVEERLDLRDGDVVIGPCFGTRYVVVYASAGSLRLKGPDGLVDTWSGDASGLARLGYRKAPE
jgi:hypothetical protein